LILRPDKQDFQGTAVALQVARKLDSPNTLLLVNKVLPTYDLQSVREQIHKKYKVPVVGVFPNTDEMIQLGSAGIFCLEYPNHAYTAQLEQVTTEMLASMG
jgi:MinD-like ATPase involved in chromosome partitioning or flagellar assembly